MVFGPVCSDMSITSLPQSFQVAFDFATAPLNQFFCPAPSIVRPGRVVVGAALELNVHARLRVAVLALVGEKELGDAAQLQRSVDRVRVALGCIRGIASKNAL